MKTILEKLQEIKLASNYFNSCWLIKRNKIIEEIWNIIIENIDIIKSENKKDLELINQSDSIYDRLLLTDNRINNISEWCYNLVKIDDPLSKYNSDKVLITSDWLTIKKIGVALWTVACIYEARPNVTIDIAIMCIKSANWIILRWWTAAKYSNNILVKLIKEVLKNNNIDTDLIYNFPLKRNNLNILYNAVWLVDVIIPRGGKWLIDSVRNNSKVAVIETWAWVVHLYLDEKINEENYKKAINVIINAKSNRISVCNALDTLVINNNIDKKIIDKLFNDLVKKWVNIISESKNINYFKEQLSLDLNIKYVNSLEQAIKHIKKYSSKHSDWILSDDKNNIDIFNKNIDSSVVYTNTSTRFSDGSCFWFGWEIWISTQKLHTRGPMWSDSLVTYKYVVDSEWKIRV